MHLRQCTAADAEALASVYREAVLVLGPQAYSREQARVWASHVEDLETFREALSEGITLCVEVDQHPIAFGQLHPADHVVYLYCRSAHARQGYASAILRELEAHARAAGVERLSTAASCIARPCFEQSGFQVVAEERVVREGIEFLRYQMAKQLRA